MLEPLEPRILYSAEASPWLAGLPLQPAAGSADEGLRRLIEPEPALPDALRHEATDPRRESATQPAAGTPATRRELVFVDAGVADAEPLIDALLAQRAPGTAIELVQIDADRDGLAQIGEVLLSERGLDAVHVISHGSPGQLQLGNGQVDAAQLLARQDSIQAWRHALQDQADLLLWGCEVGESQAGAAFIGTLARLTGADVAASTDPTGSSARGGDWALEAATGPIETATAPMAQAAAAWDGLLATFTVSNLNDTGAGSLRQAITDANANGGADSIAFSVFGTINLSSALPQINSPVSINGTNAGVPGIVLNGGGTVATGLELNSGASNSTIRGLVVQNFTSYGIWVVGATGVTIAGNYIGTNAAGNAAAGNQNGIEIFSAANTTIGGTVAADRNVISGNTNLGININGSGAGNSGTVVRGNYIGINAAGSGTLGNTNHGIYLGGSTGVTIGGGVAGAGNVISNNGTTGIMLGSTASGNTIAGNTIGLNVAGNTAMANGNGIWIAGSNNTVGGTNAAERNLVSGNTALGVRLYGASATGNTVLGNYIGTGSNGTTDLGNGQDGVQIDTGASNNTIGGTASGARNIIAGNNNSGIAIQDLASTGNSVLGNWIGVGTSGSTWMPNSHSGVWIEGTGTLVGDGTVAGRNVIAGNTQSGITFAAGATGSVVRGNWLAYNGWDGITAQGTSSGNVVGGSTALEANVIANNTADGVMVNSSASNAVAILSNNIYGNSQRGIDLSDNGYDTNDAGDGDTGANGLQNYPVLTSAAANTSGTTIVGSLNSTASTSFRIDFYTNRPGDVDGSNGEGARWLGFTTVTTNASNTATINHTLNGVWVNHGDRVTAVATRDLGGGTYGGSSEFSANITATASGVVVVDTMSDTLDGTTTSIANLGNARGGDGRISLREAITAANNTANGASADRIVFAIPPNIESLNINTALQSPVISVSSTLPAIVQPVNLDASTQPEFSTSPLVRLGASGAVTYGLQLNAGSTSSTVRGLSITGFSTAGIQVSGSNTHTIAGNYLGLAPDGSTVDANGRGLILSNTTGTTVGGTSSADRNVISGNSAEQLYLNGAVNSIVYGNYIGPDATGMLDVDGSTYGTGRSGISIDGASTGNQIGSTLPGARNVISGNNWVGVDIVWSGSANNTVAGNYIGTTATGLAALPNATGISFYGAGSGNSALANVVSGNAYDGIAVGNGSTGTSIQGNYVGLGVDGSTVVANGGHGIVVHGASTGTLIGTNADGSNDTAETNVIGGNANGIIIADAGTTGTLVQGNLIGTDASGMLDRGNTWDGIRIENSASANTIGGSTTSRRNIIAGNGEDGIQIDGEASDGNTVRGNWIGINAAGSATLGNDGDGIYISGGADNTTVGGTGTNDGNWIAGNAIVGIEVDGASTGTVIQGNRIGTDLAGTANWGHGENGILLENGASSTTVGVHAGAGGNIVAFSGQGGVFTAGIDLTGASSTGNAIFGNTVYGQAGLSIDLGSNGFTANDAAPDTDTGPNNLQNFPVLATARTNASNQLILTGTLTSAASSFYRIHFYGSTSQHSSGYGPAETYLGFADVGTNGSGSATISTTLTANVPVGTFITATATRATNGTYSSFTDTSELSRNIAAVSSTQPTVTVDTANDTLDGDTSSLSTLIANKGADGFISLREAVIAANNSAGTDRIVLPAGTLNLTRTGANEESALTGDLDITSDIDIVGAGSGQTTVSASALSDRIFDVKAGTTLTLQALSLAGGSVSSFGGGAVLNAGTFSASDVVLRNNAATSGNAGGAINNAGTVTLERVSLYDNAAALGGAVYQTAGSLSLTNVVISGNSSSSHGGGVFLSGGTATLNHVTLADNVASFNGGGLRLSAGTATLANSILADNTGSPADLSGAVTSGGYNIIEGYSGFTPAGTDRTGSYAVPARTIDPTTGHAYYTLGSGDVAINAAGGSSPATDILGATRDASPDIGAYESPTPPQTFTVTHTLDDGSAGSLRWAITQANANSGALDTIRFNIAGTGAHTINLLSALPSLTDPVILDATTDDSFAANSNRPAIVLDGNDGAFDGLVLAAGSAGSTVRGLVIRDMGGDAIEIQAGSTGNTIAGNYLGRLTEAGTAAAATEGNAARGLRVLSTGNTLGGTTAADRNVIAGNATEGIYLAAADNTVLGNYVGVLADGSTALGNGGYGIDVAPGVTGITVGGSAAGAGNVISGNGNAQVLFEVGSSGSIKGNRIGTNAAGTAVISGIGAGVYLGASNITVGGTAVGEGNTIAGSIDTDGVIVSSGATGNAILGNTIYSNAGLGIDLGDNGVTANDAAPDSDTGANNLQNFPVLAAAITNGSQINVNGRLNSAANAYYRIEFFASASGDATGHGEGQTYLGFANVATDAAGQAAFAAELAVSVAAGQVISATATRATSGAYSAFTDTSEFAANVVATSPTAPINTVPGAQTTAEDTARVFSSANGNAITVTDSDAGGANNQVTLSVTNGSLTLASTAGLSFITGDGTADSTMTLRGTAADINTALDGLSFAPTADYNGGAVLTLATTDSLLLSLDIDTGLLGRYAFENSGNLGQDTSPAGANGASMMNSPAAVVDGSRGNVMELNGNNGLQMSGVMGSPANVTLAAWVNLTAADAFGSEVISLGDRISLRVDQAGQLYGQHYNGSTFEGLAFTTTLAGTGWRHVAFTFDDTLNTRTLFLDGVAVASQSSSDSVSYAGATSTVIGRNGAGGTSHDFTGRIDEARIYNRALTADEIAALADDLALVDTDTVSITVSAVNDAPSLAVPGIQVTPVNTALVLSGTKAITVSDVDATSLQLTLTATQGSLTLNGTTGLSFSSGDGASDTSMVFTGSAADINTALNGLQFSPTHGFQGQGGIGILISDLGGTGSGGALTASASVTVQVGAASFQQGVSGYAGTQDTHVLGGSPTTSFGSATTVVADDTSAGDAGLLRFDDLFGSGLGQIPSGSTITSASLSIYVTNPDSLDSVSLHRMLSAWSEASTYNSLVGGIQANGVEAAGAATAVLDAGVSGWLTITGLASTVQAWANGAANHGWALLSNSADNWAFASSENGTPGLRPYLTVAYTPPQSASLSTSGGSAGFTENGTAVAVDPGLLLTDTDSTDMTGAVVAITSGFSAAQDTLGFTDQSGITGSWNAATGVLTLSGTATTALYQAALRSITYSNGSEAPDTTARTVSFTVSDAYATSNTATRGVTVSAVNDAPVLANTALTLTVAEDAGAPSGAVGALIAAFTGGLSDVDSGALKGIAITASDETNGSWHYSTNNGTTWTALGTVSSGAARLLADDGSTRLYFQPSANWNGSSTGALTLRGWDRTSGVAGSTADTSTSGGTTAFSSATDAVDVTVTAVNDAPAFSGLDGTPLFTEGGSAVVLDANVTVGDAELTAADNFSGATLALARQGGASSQDQFAASGTLGPLTEGGNLVVAGTTIGTVTTHSAGTLLLSFNASATQARVNAVLQQIAYRNSSDAPPASVQINWTFQDGNAGAQGSGGALSASGSTVVSLTAVNDAPVITDGSLILVSDTDEDTPSFHVQVDTAVTSASHSDADGGSPAQGMAIVGVTGAGSWQYSTDGLTWTPVGTVSASQALLLSASSRVRYQPDGQNGETATFTFRAWDQTSGSASANGAPSTANPGSGGGSSAFSTGQATVQRTVTAVNDAPVLADTALTLTVAEDAGAPSGAVGALIAAFTTGLSDVDSGAVKGIAITATDETNGTWHYSTNNGTTWTAVGSVSASAALLLADDGSTRLYFQPSANWNGSSTAALTLRGWDRTSGVAGSTADTSTNGSTTAFSSATDAVDVTVTAVNDAPVLADTALTLTVAEDAGAPSGAVGSLIAAFTGGVSDIDSGAVKGLAISATDETNGTWHYSTNNGTTWSAVGTVSASAALLLADDGNTRLYFQPSANWNGSSTAALTLRGWDRTSGVAGSTADTTSNGGTTAFSSATDAVDVTVTAVNDAPVLADTALTLTVAEDAGAPSGAVGSLIAAFTGGVSDIDSGAVKGIAITATDETNGTWHYSTNNGTTWTAVGTVNASAALLLADDGNTRLYFQPSANWNGSSTAALTLRGWDRTSGVAGSTADTTSNGGTTAFSSATDSVDVTVTAVNDAPVLADTALTVTVAEDAGAPSGAVGSLIAAFTGGVSDIDSGAVKGIAITAIDETNGTWHYSTNNGTTWTAVGTVNASAALLLADDGNTRLYFQPSANWNGNSTAALTLRGWDRTSGVAGSTADTSTSGATTAFSSATDSVDVTVTAVNDAPVLADTALTLTVAEDAGAPSGAVGSLIAAFTGGISDIDSGAVKGIAITATDETNGTWHYSTNNGTTWSAVGTVNASAALLLADEGNTRLYFQPSANWNGSSTAALTLRGWDRTSGVAGSTADTTSNGGTTAFSSATDAVDVTVNAVNDAPVLADTALTLTVAEDAGAPSGAVGALIAAFTGGLSDVDSGAVKGIAVTATDETNGTWHYSTNNGTTWTAVGSVNASAARLLAEDGNTRLYFQPSANWNGSSTAALTLRGWDRTSGVAGSTADTSTSGGTTAFSSATDSVDVAVTAVNDAPVLADTALALTVAEDAGAPSGAVGSLIAAFTGGVSDIDSGAVKGIAITATDETNGTWHYSTNNGTTWTAVGSVNASAALLLADDGNTRLYFQPSANWNGSSTAALTLRGWDRTSGVAGSTADTSTSGGTTAISSATDSVDVTVTAVNDAPVLADTALTLTVAEDAGAPSGAVGSLLSTLTGGVSDADAGALPGIAITGTDETHGTWSYSTDGGATWLPVGTVNAGSALLLAQDAGTRLHFTPAADFDASAAAALSFRAWDQTSGSAGSRASTLAHGGSSAFSSATDTVDVIVSAVNDAPVLTMPGSQVTPVGTPLALAGAAAIQVSDVDASTLQLSLVASHGSLSLTSTTGLTFSTGDGTADATMVFSGSRADVQAALGGLVFSPPGGYEGAATIDLTASDLGGSGSGGVLTDHATLAVQVGALRLQEGVDGYNGTEDTYLDGAATTTARGNAPTVVADDNHAGEAGLLRFGNLFGSGTGQIPWGSTIEAATLSIHVTQGDALDTVTVHAMLAGWSESSTHASLGGGLQADGSEAVAAPLATLDAGRTGWVDIEGLAATVQAWALGGTNQGFAFVSPDADGWAFASSEHPTPEWRPYLSVRYTPPQPAVLAASGGSATYVENAAATGVDPGLSITDADSAQLTGATVSIGAGFAAGQDVLHFSDAGGITGSWNAASGVLSLTGTASVAQYQAALRSVAFSTAGESPSAASRSIAFAVQDAWIAGGSASRLVAVQPVNDAPTITDGHAASLPATDENSASAPVSVGSLLAAAGLGDVDAGALTGLAITAASGQGQWQYSTDGSQWTAVGAVGASQALLLADGTLLRYQPDGANGETAAIAFRAWDQTSGSASAFGARSLADPGSGGGSSAFSTGIASVQQPVAAVNDAPVISGAAVVLPGTDEDHASSPVTVTALLAAAGWGDVDAGALQGIAVTSASGLGQWQYSLDGAAWTAFGPVGEAAALLLDAGTQLRYLPDGLNGETASFGFRAWDRTSGSASGTGSPSTADARASGGSTAFSSAFGSASVVVGAVNDAPTLAQPAITLAGTDEDSTSTPTPVSALLAAAGWADVDAGALQGIAITGASGQGSWQYSTGSGSWTPLGPVDAGQALLLSATSLLRYVPDGRNGEAAALVFQAWDASSGSASLDGARTTADARAAGGSSAFSTAAATAGLIVAPVNDAPVLGQPAIGLPATDEDTPGAATSVSALLAAALGSDVDAGAQAGVAITSTNGAGQWQYSTDGLQWTAIGAVSEASALLLDAASQIRYVPDGLNGETATLGLRAWDRTTGSASAHGAPSHADARFGGGSSAFSSASSTASQPVSPVNDAPVLGGAPFTWAATDEDAPSTARTVADLLAAAGVSDADAGALRGLAITSATGQGQWQYSPDGSRWTALGPASEAAAVLLDEGTWLRYQPDGIDGETAALGFRAWDRTQGSASTIGAPATGDARAHGGSQAFSSAAASLGLAVLAVNDAPELDPAPIAWPATDEDTPSVPVQVGQVLATAGWRDADPGAVGGLAITQASGRGQWQFSLDGQHWNAFGPVSEAGALLLDAGTWLRYQPDGIDGETASLGLRAWDGTTGPASADGAPVHGDARAGGGRSAFGTATVSASLPVLPVNDAPTLAQAAIALPATDEDTPSTPLTAAAWLAAAGLADADPAALAGLAVTGTAGAGQWQYSVDGRQWTPIGGPTPVSPAQALLLSAATLLRYQPDGLNGETASLQFQAWDRSSGSASADGIPLLAPASPAGGSGAFSAAVARASLGVDPVNDAPTLASAGPIAFGSTDEDQASAPRRVADLLAELGWADADAGALPGLAITGASGQGRWQHAADGQTWAEVGNPAEAQALLLDAAHWLRYLPDARNAETAVLQLRAWDGTLGQAGGTADLRGAAGGSGAASLRQAEARLSVQPVNDAPVLAGGTRATLAATDEDTASSPVSVAALLAASGWSDADAGALQGLAVTSAQGQGQWLYSSDGQRWTPFGPVAESAALLLGPDAQLRYQPDGRNGESAQLGFRAWDGTRGSASAVGQPARADLGAAGWLQATGAVSAALGEAVLAVASVNDAPVLDAAALPALPATDEDTPSPAFTIAQLLAASGGSDVDAGAITGAAIVGASGNGQWAYSLDGQRWIDLGAPDPARALHLGASAQLRYSPDAANGETALLRLRAWDVGSTAGALPPAAVANAAGSGGDTSAYSLQTVEARLAVQDLNDAPVLALAEFTLPAVDEDSPSDARTVRDWLEAAGWRDADAGARPGMAVTGLQGQGEWQTSPDGRQWTRISGVSPESAMRLAGDSFLRYQPDGRNGETAWLSFRAWDGSDLGQAASQGDAPSARAAASGSDTAAYSQRGATFRIRIEPVNDAPVLQAGAPVALGSSGAVAATAVASLVARAGGADVDADDRLGVAVTATSGNGTWQYSTDGRAWTNFGSVSDRNALLLDASAQVRYVPDTLGGETARFAFRTWDRSEGRPSASGAPAHADTTASGGDAAFSAQTGSAAISTAASSIPLPSPAPTGGGAPERTEPAAAPAPAPAPGPEEAPAPPRLAPLSDITWVSLKPPGGDGVGAAARTPMIDADWQRLIDGLAGISQGQRRLLAASSVLPDSAPLRFELEAPSLRAMLNTLRYDAGDERWTRIGWIGQRLPEDMSAQMEALQRPESVVADMLGEVFTPSSVAGLTLTASLLYGLTRGGGLLMSVLMGMPAWRHIDLLPVVTAGSRDDRRDRRSRLSGPDAGDSESDGDSAWPPATPVGRPGAAPPSAPPAQAQRGIPATEEAARLDAELDRLFARDL